MSQGEASNAAGRLHQVLHREGRVEGGAHVSSHFHILFYDISQDIFVIFDITPHTT